MRLDKFISSQTGISRSDAKKIIKNKNVSVNGNTVTTIDHSVNETKDVITLDGEEITYEKYVYYLLNKPSGVVSATKDNLHKTVLDLIKDEDKRKDLFPVGRLDIDTEGLLIITNDGDFSHQMLSPSKHVNKTYFSRLKGKVTSKTIEAFAEGINIGTTENPELCQSATIEIIDYNEKDNISSVYITISEGKYHQIKRMAIKCGHEVVFLKRISMGNYTLPDNLPSGKYIKL